MCSTFKWLLAAQLLANVDRGVCRLDEAMTFGRSDLLEYAPLTSRHVERGTLTLGELAAAAVVVSDNTAANLLLTKLGGPSSLTAFARSLGDRTTRLDRIEPALNANAPGDVRDTTTPRGMVISLRSVLAGDVLSPVSRTRLFDWLVACETGRDRLRAGFPTTWSVGDKTGSGANGAVNDVAIAIPPTRKPMFAASYLSGSRSTTTELAAAHAEIGLVGAMAFGSSSGERTPR